MAKNDNLHKFSLYNETVKPYLNSIYEADQVYYKLRSISKKDQTLEMIQDAIANYAANCERPILGVISKRLLTKELCWTAFQEDKRNFIFISKKFVDEEMCFQAVGYCGRYLSCVPQEYITPKLCVTAVTNMGSSLEYVPEKFKTTELCIKALNNSDKDRNKYAIEFIPTKIMRKIGRKTANEISVKQNPCSIQSIPSKYITSELVELAVSGMGNEAYKTSIIQYIPKRLLTESLICKAIELNPRSINDISEKLITVELLKNHPNCIEYISLDCIGREKRELLCKEFNLTDDSINHTTFLSEETVAENPKQINAPPGKRCVQENSILLNLETTQHSVTNNIGTNKKEQVSIYYVTDLHLEHHIDFSKIASDKAYEQIDEFVKRMLVTADAPGIVLTGGDISSYTCLNIMFYNSLRSNWDGPIVSVLGNHDLWNLDENGLLGLKPPEALEKLRDNTHCINFLENGLYIKLSDKVYGYRHELSVDEDNLLAVDEDELTEYCHKANVIILGGLGFSGCNENFNATNGIYVSATTRENDLEYSRRFKAVYSKLLRCASDVPVIVLTHTPMRDWSKQQYNRNWIYISGHTHKNVMAMKENGAIVLENNQFGYGGKTCTLKKFILNHAKYDPLAEIEDGIHKISKLQYLDFMFVRKTPVPEMKRTGIFWVIKRDNLYLFMLETKGNNYILNGAGTQIAKKNKEYYYNNISKYYDNVNYAFSSFHQYEETISSLVQAVGGVGTIHGCIVDYDYYNHVFVNPFDKSITPYFATSMTYKVALPNFEAIIGGKENVKEVPTNKKSMAITAKNNALQLLNSKIVSTNSQNEIITDTTIYRISNIFRTLQYTIESRIIRKWNDAILNLPENCAFSELSHHIAPEIIPESTEE